MKHNEIKFIKPTEQTDTKKKKGKDKKHVKEEDLNEIETDKITDSIENILDPAQVSILERSDKTTHKSKKLLKLS